MSFFCSLNRSITCLIKKIASVVDLPCMKPNWFVDFYVVPRRHCSMKSSTLHQFDKNPSCQGVTSLYSMVITSLFIEYNSYYTFPYFTDVDVGTLAIKYNLKCWHTTEYQNLCRIAAYHVRKLFLSTHFEDFRSECRAFLRTGVK